MSHSFFILMGLQSFNLYPSLRFNSLFICIFILLRNKFVSVTGLKLIKKLQKFISLRLIICTINTTLTQYEENSLYLQFKQIFYSMPGLNHHRQPYDEGTLTKLELFEKYAEAWIPTFVMSRYSEIFIFDFFAGTGRDSEGIPGSAIRLLKQIDSQTGNIFKTKTKIHLVLNELDGEKYATLKYHCESYITKHPNLQRLPLDIEYCNEDVTTLFPKRLDQMRKNPALVYLDPNGVKFLADKYLLELEKMHTTDFMYFISSSYFLRFGETEQFQNNITIDIDRARKDPYNHIHRSVLKQLREQIPDGSNFRLYPFTIKKNTNVYGIIFGASHPLAIDKFLRAAWSMNAINGEANFDIDDEENRCKPNLFDDGCPTKIEVFQNKLHRLIMSGRINDNVHAYTYTLLAGHIPDHAVQEIKKMKNDGLITYQSKSPCVNYDNAFKNKKIVKYTIIKPEL